VDPAHSPTSSAPVDHDARVGIDGLVVNRWRRWGKDRLYVETSEGAKVGYWDLEADTGHPELPEHDSILTAAVAHWKQSQPGGPTAAPPPPALDEAVSPAAAIDDAVLPDDPRPVGEQDVEERLGRSNVLPEPTAPRPWVDLATNRPGAEARELADAARNAAPVRTAFARVLGVHTDERAWRIGADGEEKVAAQLAKAQGKDPRWRLLHAVPVGARGSDIDHLVIGPGGVFTVNAKHHPHAAIWVGGNTFLVNGSKQPYIRNARHEALRASAVLSQACGFPVHVEGLVVTVNAKSVTVKAQPDGVTVVPRMQVARWLRRHGDIHSEEVVEAIHEVARRSTTWR